MPSVGSKSLFISLVAYLDAFPRPAFRPTFCGFCESASLKSFLSSAMLPQQPIRPLLCRFFCSVFELDVWVMRCVCVTNAFCKLFSTTCHVYCSNVVLMIDAVKVSHKVLAELKDENCISEEFWWVAVEYCCFSECMFWMVPRGFASLKVEEVHLTNLDSEKHPSLHSEKQQWGRDALGFAVEVNTTISARLRYASTSVTVFL